jgi:hypothetical protein
VPNTSGDASDAIRQAFEKAKSLQAGDGYAGVRLERGAIYSVASEMAGGDLFALKDLRHNRLRRERRDAQRHVERVPAPGNPALSGDQLPRHRPR